MCLGVSRVELYHNATALQTSLLGRLKWLFIAVNAFLYVFLIIVVAVYAARVNKKDIALCGDSSTRDKASVALTKCVPIDPYLTPPGADRVTGRTR